jgi:hypothetical protein
MPHTAPSVGNSCHRAVARWGDKYHGGVPADHFDKAGRFIFADPENAHIAEIARAVHATMTSVTFGTPAVYYTNGAVTSFTLSPSGVTSGQPLVLCGGHTTSSSAVISTISDNFSTPYTWTKVTGASEVGSYYGSEIWVGTGGAGTSGTISVSCGSAYWTGVVVPCIGASTASGLSIVDQSGHTGYSAQTVAPSLTPTNSGEGAVYSVLGGVGSLGVPGGSWTNTQWGPSGGTNYGWVSKYPSPTQGSALQPTWSGFAASYAVSSAVLILAAGAGYTVTFNAKGSTGQSVQRASTW